MARGSFRRNRVWLRPQLLSLRRGVLLASALVAHAAHAKPTGDLDLRWQRLSGCPSEASLRAQIHELVPSEKARSQPLRVEATVRTRRGRFELALVLVDGDAVGKRTFTGDTCEEVTGAAAVAIALSLRETDDAAGSATSGAGASATEGDATSRGEGGDSASKDAAESKKAGEDGSDDGDDEEEDPDDDDGASDAASSAESRGLHWFVDLPVFDVGIGLLPQAMLGLSGGVGVEWNAWRFGLSGTWSLDTTVASPGGAASSAVVSRQALSLSTCRWFAFGSAGVAPCATVSGEHLHASGQGQGVTPGADDAVWLALGPAVLGRLRMGSRFAVLAHVGVEIETARPLIVIEGQGTVEQVGLLHLTSRLGAEWIF